MLKVSPRRAWIGDHWDGYAEYHASDDSGYALQIFLCPIGDELRVESWELRRT